MVFSFPGELALNRLQWILSLNVVYRWSSIQIRWISTMVNGSLRYQDRVELINFRNLHRNFITCSTEQWNRDHWYKVIDWDSSFMLMNDFIRQELLTLWVHYNSYLSSLGATFNILQTTKSFGFESEESTILVLVLFCGTFSFYVHRIFNKAYAIQNQQYCRNPIYSDCFESHLLLSQNAFSW